MEKKLPKGWVETELGNYAILKNGYAYKTTQFKESGIPILKISNITKEGKVDLSKVQYVDEKDLNDLFIVKKGDILIAMSGATTGKFGVYNLDRVVLQNQRIGNLKLQNKKLGNKKFLYYVIASLNKKIEDKAYGGAQPNISSTLIESIKFNLPPLAEQERIANKLDELFVRVEVIKKSMDKIPQLLKDFRQQVLTSAVTGKLTEEWREGKDLEEWKECKVNDVLLDKPRNGFSPKAVEYITEVKSLALSATTSGRFNPVYVKYLDIPKPQKDSHLWLMKGDILVQRSNSLEYVGTSAIYDGENYDFIYPDIMMKLRVNTLIFNKMLYYILSCNKTKEYFRLNASGTAGNMPKINQKIISDLLFLLPSLIEQEEIIKRVESLFIKADQIEKQYKALKEKIGVLPQLLLHKAFKGELVEQLPTDGDAAELLKEIMALKKK